MQDDAVMNYELYTLCINKLSYLQSCVILQSEIHRTFWYAGDG